MRSTLILMRRTEKVKNDLDRVECSERNLNEKSVPVAHGTIPEAREFESLEFAALITLRTYESCVLIHIFQKVETLSLIIMEAANDVNRIEMGSRSKRIACMVV